MKCKRRPHSVSLAMCCLSLSACGRVGFERLTLFENRSDGGTAQAGGASITSTAAGVETSSSDAPTFDIESSMTGTLAPTSLETAISQTTSLDTPPLSGASEDATASGTTSNASVSLDTASAASVTDDTGITASSTSATELATSTSELTASSDETAPSLASSSSDSPSSSSGAVCTPGGYATPQALNGIAAPAYSPSLSADRLTLVYASNGELYTATRATAESLDFAAVTALTEVNTADTELTPQLSTDGLRLYFSRGVDPGRDIYVAERATPGDTFGVAVKVGPLNTSYFSEILPRERGDGLEVFFTSARSASLFDVFVARRSAITNAYGAPVLVTELNTASDESPGGLSSDGLRLLLASKRTGGLGGQDVWTAARPDQSSAFTTVTNEATVNTTFNELDPTLSADDQELLFASDRSGQVLIYSALRCPL